MVLGFKVEKVVDTVVAGDGFAAGVICGILEGMSTEDSVKRGNAIGTMPTFTVIIGCRSEYSLRAESDSGEEQVCTGDSGSQ